VFSSLLLKPIGIFESAQIEPYQAGRQPDELGLFGRIKLNSGENFEQALQDLEGCSHLWIIFGFHHNENWKPLVQTPRSTKKIGVFATRAPYRPNPIGLSLVQLTRIEGLTLDIGANDLLDGTPIYDIKPYHPEYDSAEEARIEWLENSSFAKNSIFFSPLAENQLEYLENGVPELRSFIIRQLEFDPTNKDKKRVVPTGHGNVETGQVEVTGGFFTLSYRTWRIDFSFSENSVGVLNLRSGYSDQELKEFDDKYGDKKIHRQFNKEFN
jgi:tRNA (adenine37-N6)-methyltransferase